jgi:predicted CXXCH cytochrome family protein
MSKLKNMLFSLVMLLFGAFTYLAAPAIFTVGMLAVSDTADAAECTLYETIHPNFPLTGAHLSVGKCSTCASCHAGGTYLGTPKVCATCHNGNPIGQISSATIGRSAAHPPIGSASCDACHNTSSFTATWQMKHASVNNLTCTGCHNGSYNNYGAMPKDVNHVPANGDCGVCHVPLDNPTHTNADWSISLQGIHAGIVTGCVSCHDGNHHPAMGKVDYAPGHPATSDACETCHSINNSFKCADLIKDQVFMHNLRVFALNKMINKKTV